MSTEIKDSEKIQLPSDRYFELIKTREDLDKLISTGMAWVVEPNCPLCWEDHLKLEALFFLSRCKYCSCKYLDGRQIEKEF